MIKIVLATMLFAAPVLAADDPPKIENPMPHAFTRDELKEIAREIMGTRYHDPESGVVTGCWNRAGKPKVCDPIDTSVPGVLTAKGKWK